MPAELFLPGSLPCETAEQSFRTFGGAARPVARLHAGRRSRHPPLLDRRRRVSRVQRSSGARDHEISRAREGRRAMVAARPARRVCLSRQARRQGRPLRRSRLAARLCPRRGRVLRAVPLHEEGRRHPAAGALPGLHAADLFVGALLLSRRGRREGHAQASPRRCAPRPRRSSR